MKRDIKLREFEARDVDWLVESHAELYARDEGFDDSFGPLVQSLALEFLGTCERGRERGWVAARDEWRLGCIFCVRSKLPQTAKLRMFLVLPEARGIGLGTQLLTTCMGFARARGYGGMQLWTHASHSAACALYAAHGWNMVEAHPVHSFGVDLVEQTWEIVF